MKAVLYALYTEGGLTFRSSRFSESELHSRDGSSHFSVQPELPAWLILTFQRIIATRVTGYVCV